MSKATVQIGGKSDKYKRSDFDFYPTPIECTLALIEFLKIPLSTSIKEPACGDGHISKVLLKHGYDVESSDLRFTGYGLGGIDYLKDKRESKTECIITNPPFDLAEKFILKSTMESDLTAMLLKSTYWHSQKRFNTFKKTQPAFVLPFTWRPNFAPERGKSPTMDFLWTVWKKGVTECKYIPLLKASNKLSLF